MLLLRERLLFLFHFSKTVKLSYDYINIPPSPPPTWLRYAVFNGLCKTRYRTVDIVTLIYGSPQLHQVRSFNAEKQTFYDFPLASQAFLLCSHNSIMMH